MDAIAARVKARFTALPAEQRTVEAWSQLVIQEIMHEVADFLAKAVVAEFDAFMTTQHPRWRWKERSRLVRLIRSAGRMSERVVGTIRGSLFFVYTEGDGPCVFIGVYRSMDEVLVALANAREQSGVRCWKTGVGVRG